MKHKIHLLCGIKYRGYDMQRVIVFGFVNYYAYGINYLACNK